MSVSYNQLARFYDRLMVDAPYEDWIRFAEAEWAYYQLKPERVMDLACGTGNISILMDKKGYQVTSLDLSADMLAIAEEKARNVGASIRLYCQDMTEFESPELMDSIVCFCDSLNYLTETAAVTRTFECVYRALRPGGVFLFDVHSLFKIRESFGNESFHWIEEDLVYVWDCQLDEHDVVEHFLTFFIRKEGALYERFEEAHVQRGYSERQLRDWLTDAGFVNIRCHADFQPSPPTQSSERLFFSCQKPS